MKRLMRTHATIRVQCAITRAFASSLPDGFDAADVTMDISRYYYRPKADPEYLQIPVRVKGVRVATINLNMYTGIIEDVRVSRQQLSRACSGHDISPEHNYLTLWEDCHMPGSVYRIARAIVLDETLDLPE